MSMLDVDWAARRGDAEPVGLAVAPGGLPSTRAPATDEPIRLARLERRADVASSGPGGRRRPGRGPGAHRRQGPRGRERPAQRSIGSRPPSPRARSSGRRRSTQMLGDLMVALEQDDGQKLGGKSAEAARFILRAISRELDNA